MTRTGLFLYDLLKGTTVRKTNHFLQQSQHWKPGDLAVYQQEKLGHLLTDSAVNVPFYKQLYAGYTVENKGQIKLAENLPVIDRKMTMEAGGSLLNDNINLKKCKVSRTGGTTGPPLRIYRDTETRSWALGAFYRFYEWMGIEPGMPEAELWGRTDTGNQHISNTKLFDHISRFRSYNAFSFNDRYLESVVSDMQRFKPRFIRGYLSAILLLADYIKRNNIKGIKPIAVSSTAETLFPEYRKKIEEIFQAPLFNQYGCGECNSIAFECRERNGLHITMEHCLLETDDNDQFIITNLDNYSQPFIRYKNGDTGKINYKHCPCGNASPRITELYGRINENIILKDGSSVNGVFFANLLDDAGFINNDQILRFQVIQDKAGEINLKTEVREQLSDHNLKILNSALLAFFSRVEISQSDYLEPGPGGKFRYLISNIKSI